jgi:rare lipoprotein A
MVACAIISRLSLFLFLLAMFSRCSKFEYGGKTALRVIACAASLLLTHCTSIHENQVRGFCRSAAPYKIAGEWYHPQQHYNYDKKGIASWYGPGFHGLQKAQGEVYDQYEMTAAHKTLPLPTIAKVTNLETGKSIVVLVDDRGPFKYKGRIIDLSVSAARELGVYDKGTGRVRVTALPKESDAFAMYLKYHGIFKSRRPRRWVEIYRQEIRGKGEYKELTRISAKVQAANKEDRKEKLEKSSVPFLQKISGLFAKKKQVKKK